MAGPAPIQRSIKLELQTSVLSALNFRISRFGDSHGSVTKTGAIAQTAQVGIPTFTLGDPLEACFQATKSNPIGRQIVQIALETHWLSKMAGCQKIRDVLKGEKGEVQQ